MDRRALLDATRGLDNLRDFAGQIFGFGFGRGFSVDADGVLGAAGTGEGAALADFLDLLVDLRLHALGAGKLTLRICCLENGAVVDEDLGQAVGEIGVGGEPLLRSPVLVCEHDLHKQEVGERVANRLIDQVDARMQNLESLPLPRIAWLVLLDVLECVVREDDRTMAVSLKVDTDVELLGGMVEVFDPSRRAVDLQFKILLNVLGRCAVRICGLYNTNLECISKSTLTYQIAKERCHKSCNSVTVKKSENVLCVLEVVDDTVGVAVERTASIASSSF